MPSSSVHAPQKACPGCPFGGPKVGSKGDPTHPLVFVAESPGVEEVRHGEPLIGPSGKIFHTFVPEGPSGPYVLNAMECRPISGLKGEKIMDRAAHNCQGRLLRKVAAHPRRLVVAMGNSALRSLTGNFGLKITQVRGRLMKSELAELGILPMVHIAALMRGTGSWRQWQEDIQYALELGGGGEPRRHIPAEVTIVPDDATRSDVEAIFEWALRGTRELTGDIETTGFSHIQDRILSVGVTSDNDVGRSFSFYPVHFPLIKPYLEDRTISWCWHNGKFDIKFLRQAGIHAFVADDTMLMSYTLDETGGIHDLETVAADVLDAPDYKHMIKPYLPNKEASYELVPKEILARYQAIDTSNTAQIRRKYRRRIMRDADLEKLYTKTLIPASEMLAWVESNGIYTDPKRLEENETYFQTMKDEIGGQINEMIGYKINPGSPKQVSELLFRQMKFPNRHKGSTAEDVLLDLQRKTEDPIFSLLLKHRKAVKMYGTYVKGLKKFVIPETNRIHATYLIHGTKTGRLAARNPNLQNPPRDPQIRGTFMASPGHELLEIDLSQAELRSLAALSQDPALLRVYLDNLDLHSDLANYLYPGWDERAASEHKVLRQIAKEERVRCKNVNFGIIYGITAFGLMEQINDTRAAAQEMLDGWAERYPVAWGFIQKCRAAPLNNQVITTCFGRKKRVGLVTMGNLNFLQNEAANFPHQSIASDITLHTAIRVWRPLALWGVKIVNLVHDAIIMEVPISPENAIREMTIELVQAEMAQVPRDWGITAVPFKSDAEVGSRWGSLRKVEHEATEEVAA